jgi:hypothetical protein
LTVEGELFVEAVTGVSDLVSGTTLKQTIVGGSGLALAIETSGQSLATLTGGDLLLVLSEDENDANNRWLSATASIDGLTVAGGSLAYVNTATLSINEVLSGSGTAINWSGANAKTVALSARDPSLTGTLALADARYQVTIDGGLDFGPARIAGAFNLLKTTNGTDPEWTLNAANVQVAVEAGGARVALTNGSGNIYVGPNGTRRSLSGDAEISGLGGLSLGGTLSASVAGNDLTLTGTNVAVNIDGLWRSLREFCGVEDWGRAPTRTQVWLEQCRR